MRDLESQERLLVLCLPDWRKQNPYLNLLASGLETRDVDVAFTDFETGLFPLFKAFRKHRDARVLHLHWINQLIAPLCWKGGSVKRAMRFMALRLDGFLVHVFGGQIVWTIHNLQSHEAANPEVERRARRALFQVVDKAVVHSDGARSSVVNAYRISNTGKLSVIPHGNYLQSYLPDQERQKTLSDELGVQRFGHVFLFFGGVREYKGLMDLIAAFRQMGRQDVCLVIAGKPDNPETQSSVTRAADQDPRVIFYLGYVPDEDVAPLFALATAVVLPFRRILTSGSAVLAMSMGKAMILPDDADILGGVDDCGVQFYESNDIREALENILDRDTEEMGRHNLSAVSANTWPEIGRQYRDLYFNVDTGS